jgi:hypothetical protein
MIAVMAVIESEDQNTDRSENGGSVAGLSKRLPSLRHWTSSGEVLSTSLLNRFRQAAPTVTLANLYGCTEIAGDVSCKVFRAASDVELTRARACASDAELSIDRCDAELSIGCDAELSIGCDAELSIGCDAELSIGSPIDNCAVHLLRPKRQIMQVDDTPVADLEEVEEGAEGEMFISGACLAKGYYNRPEETARRFVSLQLGTRTVRAFRTGDFARLSTSASGGGGELHYVGRRDQQVKIRGHRVELLEVETLLSNAYTGARSAADAASCVIVIVARKVQIGGGGGGGGGGGRGLCEGTSESTGEGFMRLEAFVVGVVPSSLRKTAEQVLPAYMRPAVYHTMRLDTGPLDTGPPDRSSVPLPVLPCLPNGKVDRVKLVEIAEAQQPLVRAGSGSLSDTEQMVATVVSTVLGIDSGIDSSAGVIDSDIFAELGCDSVTAVLIASRLGQYMRSQPSMQHLAFARILRTLVTHPCLRDFCQALDSNTVFTCASLPTPTPSTSGVSAAATVSVAAQGVILRPLQAADAAEAASLLGRVFGAKDPCMLARGVEGSMIVPWLTIVCEAMARPDGGSGDVACWSWAATNEATGAIVGVSLNEDFLPEGDGEEEGPPPPPDGLLPILEVVDALEEQGREKYRTAIDADGHRCYPPASVLHNFAIAADGDGEVAAAVAIALTEQTVSTARASGFKAVVSTDVNFFFQEVDKSLGFVELASVQYKDCPCFQGKHQVSAPHERAVLLALDL